MGTISLHIACLTLAQLAADSQPDSNPAVSQPPVRPLTSPADPLPRSSASPAQGAATSPVRPAGRISDTRTPLGTIAAPPRRDSLLTAQTDLGGLAQRLVEQSVRPIEGDKLPGKQTSLLEVLRQGPDQTRRTRVVKAYWQLVAAIGNYHFAAEEEQFLAEAGRPESAVEEALLEAAIAESAARRQAAKVTVLRLQHVLAEEALLPVFAELPWPTDTPLVGAYRTRFQDLFAGQPQPIRLQQIDRALPHLLNWIDLQAQAVSTAQRALQAVSEARPHRQASVLLWLDTRQKLSHQRRQFLTAVLEYNTQIADYAVTVAGPSTPAEILVSTLITTSANPALVPVPAAPAGAIRNTSATEPLEAAPAQPAFRQVSPRANSVEPTPRQPAGPQPLSLDGTKSVLKGEIRIAR